MDKNLEQTLAEASSNGISNTPGNELRVQVIQNEDDFHALEEEWKHLTDNADYSIFQTFEWNKIWWKHFGSGKKLHIIAFYNEAGQLLAIIPFFWDTITVFNKEVYSCLRFIGSSVSQPDGENLKGLHPYSDYLNFIIKTGYELVVIDSLLDYLENVQECDEILLDEIPETSRILNVFISELHKRELNFTIKKSSKCPVIKLNGSWEEYQDSLSKKSRYNNNRALRMIDEDSEKGFHLDEAGNSCELEEIFGLLVDLHQKRWNQIGFPGVFGEKRMLEFQREIMHVFFKKGWVQLKKAAPVKDPGKAIAVDLMFRYKKHIYMVHRALDQESPFSKAGPGNILLSSIVKEAADEGFEIVDFLRGTEPFKFRTANAVHQNLRLVIKTSSLRKSLRNSLLKAYVVSKRRVEVEKKQLILFRNGKTLTNGLKGYLNFLYSRIRYKMKERKQGEL
ncbi:MAG: GNAT family N-acetyltransferase [Balneolaceae bacterium]